MKKQSLLSKVLVFVVIGVVVLFGILLAFKVVNQNILNSSIPEQNTTLDSQVLVNVIDTNNQTQSYKVEDTNEIFASELLNNLDKSNESFSIEYKRFDFGNMIISVNGIEPSASQFWNIKVNGVDAQVGVDQLIINAGDTLTLSLVSF